MTGKTQCQSHVIEESVLVSDYNFTYVALKRYHIIIFEPGKILSDRYDTETSVSTLLCSQKKINNIDGPYIYIYIYIYISSNTCGLKYIIL